MSSTGLAFSQPAGSQAQGDDLICVSIPDAQEMVRRLTDYDLLRELDQVKDQRITNLEKETDLLKRENELKDRVIGIKDMEIAATRRAFEDMKEISDRSLKLAETAKPKTNWQTIGIGILAAILLGLALGK